ncbi:hypothetical protein ACU4GR_23695 [Methylobacterium oryzae CBMB20]
MRMAQAQIEPSESDRRLGGTPARPASTLMAEIDIPRMKVGCDNSAC